MVPGLISTDRFRAKREEARNSITGYIAEVRQTYRFHFIQHTTNPEYARANTTTHLIIERFRFIGMIRLIYGFLNCFRNVGQVLTTSHAFSRVAIASRTGYLSEISGK